MGSFQGAESDCDATHEPGVAGWPSQPRFRYAFAVSNPLFEAQLTAVAAGMARETGCDPAMFAREELSIVPRPDPPAWAFTVMLCTFGTGTVLSVDPEYLEFVRQRPPKRHFRAFNEGFLAPIVAEGTRRGVKLGIHTGAIGYALATVPAVQPVEDIRFEFAAPEWMAAERASGVFHNALGTPSEDYRDKQYRFAILARTSTGELAAVAGVFDTTGLHEIGVDVARDFRGRGLANAVVARAAATILQSGETPFYSCGVTNIRSQRTALASGFLPVCSMAYVAPEDPGQP